MSWKRQRSRISLRNLLRNKKTAVIAAVCCVVAVGAYVGFHHFTSEAGNETVIRGMLNYDDSTKEYSVRTFDSSANSVTYDVSQKSADRKTWGTATNPVVILELVPWQGYSEMGYMIEGCEPVDIYTRVGVYDAQKAAYYRSIGEEDTYDSYSGTVAVGTSWMNMGTPVTECFEEEDYPGKDLSENDTDYKYHWLKQTDSNGHTIKGYYEKVAGTKVEGYFNITGVDADGRPVFTAAENGDFIWVSLGGNAPLYDYHQTKENKSFQSGATLNEVKSAYAAGDREYTTRTEKTYYSMSNSSYYVDENGVAHNDLVPKAKFVHYNDFLRYTLDQRTIEDVNNYSIVVKPVDSAQLNAHPELIDYADLIYIHVSSESGIVNTDSFKNAQDFEKLNTTTSSGKEGDTFYDNDISWEIAERLFFKANALTKYTYKSDGTIDKTEFDYSGNGKYAYAPVILAKSLLDGLKGGSSHNDETKYLNYDTMTLNSYSGGTTGQTNNFYKFCLMDLLMDQDTFYEMFYTPLDSTHQPVIQTINGEGYNTLQKGDAQYYWCPAAFLPYVKGITDQSSWETSGKELCEKYGINIYNNSFLNFPGAAILSYTYIYNSNGMIFVLGTSSNLDSSDEYTGNAFTWYDEQGNSKSNLNTLDIIYFMWNYSKGGNNSTGSRSKASIKSLEIEPSNDFYLNETSLKALLPATKYKMTIEEPVHMTTAEFNGSKIDLSEYDLIYVGTCRGKMNTAVQQLDHGTLGGGWFEEDDTRYNDSGLAGKLYLHVGDVIKSGSDSYRLSGTDITKQQMQNLVAYAKSGDTLIFDDVLYNGNTSGNALYTRNVDITSNMNTLIEKVGSRSNVVSLTTLKTSNVVSTEEKGAAISITTPKPYYNVDDTDDEQLTSVKTTLSNNKLTFTFTIGYPGDDNVAKDKNTKYGVRLYVDTNGDGIITEAEDGSELCTWDSDAQTGAVYAAGTIDSNGKEQKAKYSISYTVDKERTNGAIAWKFEVFSTDNENIKTTVSGVSRYNGNEENDEKVKNEIKVLQVIPEEEYNASSSSANLEKEIAKAKSASLFAKYAKDLDDYEITVKTIPLKKSATTVDKMGYVDAFAYVNSNDYDTASNARENFTAGGDYYYPSIYKDYDVYLFSCGDKFEKADNSNGAVAFAYWLSENGRSVIYTADSIYDADSTATDGVQKLLKDSAGLSRYTSSSESTKKYNDTASYANSSNAEAEYKSSDYDGYNNLEYTYNKLTELGKKSDNTYLAFDNDQWKTSEGSKVTYGSDTETTETLSQINKGTICVYPYTISEPDWDITDRFEDEHLVPIAGYASQDYQLNLANPMADVWYCLYSTTDTSGTDTAVESEDNITTYGISPNDAANNYYLYNVDNVFYSGISLDSSKTTKLEMQLFINTLIGASEASYDYPYITADKLEILSADDEDDLTEDELKIKLVSATDEERDYKFSVSGNVSQLVEDYQYKEYVAGATAIPKSSPSPSPTPTMTPSPSPTPTLDPDATPEPTATPEATPITLMENPFASTGAKWETKNAEWMKGLSNDAVLQFSYRCSNKVDGSDYVLETHGGYDSWDYGKYFTACVDGSTDATEIQVVRMTVGEFKQSFASKVSLTDDLVYVCLQPYNYNTNVILLSVRLYEAGVDIGDGTTDSTLDDGDTTDGDVTLDEEKMTDSDFLAATDTHKIYFTPYDGNLVGGHIKAVTASFVSDKNDNANTITMPINSIYREKKSGTEIVTYRITDSNGTGQFLESEKHFLTDSVQYFIPYNKTYVAMFPYIKLTIQNKKKSSVTYLEVNDLITQQKNTKDVYMFNLD